MADALSDLTESKWDALKKGAKIPNTNIFKALLGGAASVGSAISSYQKARAEWKAFKSGNSVMDYFKALEKLESSLVKFTAIKEFKSPEAKSLKVAVDGWIQDARAKKAKVAKFHDDNQDALKANNIAALKARVGGAGLDL